MTGAQDGCGAPAGGITLGAGELATQAVIQGRVTHSGTPASVGYARLLNADGEFVAEVPLGADGGFRFFAVSGRWILRILAPGNIREERTVTAATGQVTEVDVPI